MVALGIIGTTTKDPRMIHGGLLRHHVLTPHVDVLLGINHHVETNEWVSPSVVECPHIRPVRVVLNTLDVLLQTELRINLPGEGSELSANLLSKPRRCDFTLNLYN